MPSQKILGCHTKHRIQRLLWSPEYESYMNLGSDGEPIVLVESPFVLETKDDGVDKMVYVGLTTESLVIAEENLKSSGERENLDFYEAPDIDDHDDADGDWDLQDFRLRYLYPLQHVRLSVRQYREKEGEHVLRLRIGEETDHSHLKTMYLELAGRHREFMWLWWKNWIEELDKRRKEQRHRMKTFNRNIKPGLDPDDAENIEFGELNLDFHRDDHGWVLESNQRTRDSNQRRGDDEFDGASRTERRQQLKEWHVQEYMVRNGGEHSITVLQQDSTLDVLSTEVTEADVISRCTQYGIPIPPTLPTSPSFYTKIGLPVPDELIGSDVYQNHRMPEKDVDSCSSLEDILSVGSLVDSDVDWHHAVSTEVNDRLVLCIGNLFERSHVEIHDHGHAARLRPIASDTALDRLLEFEETNLSLFDDHSHFVGIDKEKLHHTCSMQDTLEGEAAFLEDDYEASQVTHRQSFVAMDIVNENTELQAHIINGHVLLVTKKELKLEKELIQFREEPKDLDFTTCKHIGRRHLERFKDKQMVQTYKKARKKKLKTKGKILSKLHIDRSKANTSKDLRKHAPHQVDDLPKWAVGIPDRVTMISDEIPPEAMARELTLIDKELFLMIHEAELVNCMWMKPEKHSKAPNVMKSIEFFERVVRTVSSEIINRNYDWARAKAMAYFTKVAKTCFELQNFHSLKAILCGMQVPSIYRLMHSWSDFADEYPDEFKEFTHLAHLMADEGCSPDYFKLLKKAEENPPYLPFLGAFLKNIIDLFTVKDEGGMRTQRKKKQHDYDENSDDHDCHTTTTGVCFHSGESSEDSEDTSSDEDRRFSLFFQKVHDTRTASHQMSSHSQHSVVYKSPSYLMNETLFHYQISAIQYKWSDIPQIRDFWMRNQLEDEVSIWKKSKAKEDLMKVREEKHIRMARKREIEAAYQKMMERQQKLSQLAGVTAKTNSHTEKQNGKVKKKDVEKEQKKRKNKKKTREALAEEATGTRGRRFSVFGRKKKKH